MLLRITLSAAFIFTLSSLIYAQDCLPSLLREGDRLRQLKDYQQALYRFKAALTCDDIDLAKFKEVYRRIESTEREYENTLLEERVQLQRQRKAAELAVEAIRLKETDPNLALQLLQTACELSDNSNPLAVEMRKNLLSDPRLLTMGKLLEGRKVKTAAFSPDGRYLVLGGPATNGSITLMPTDNQNAPISADGSLGHIIAVAFVPGSSAFVAVNTRGDVYRCNDLEKFEFSKIKSLGLTPTALAIAKDGSYAIVGDLNGKTHYVNLLEIKTMMLLMTTNEATGDFDQQVFGAEQPDEKGVMVIEDERSAYEPYRLLPINAVRALSINEKDQILACTAEKAWIFEAGKDDKKEISGFEGLATTACFTPSGRQLMLGTSTGAIYFYNIKTLNKPFAGTLAHSSPVHKLLCTTGGFVLTETAESASLWQFDQKELDKMGRDFSWTYKVLIHKKKLPGYSFGNLEGFALSPDGSLALTTAGGEYPRLFDLKELQSSAQPTLVSQSAAITKFAIDPTRRWVACAELGGALYLYDALTGATQQTTVPGGKIEHMIFGGEVLFVENGYGNIYRWNSYKVKLEPFSTQPGSLKAMSVSSDGRYVALVRKKDKQLLVLNEIGRLVGQSFLPQTGEITSLAFFPSGDSLIIGKENGELGILTTRSVQNGHDPMGSFHVGEVKSIIVSPDGLHFLSMGGHTVIVWPLSGDFSKGAQAIKSFQVGEDVAAVNFSNDGKYLATASPFAIDLWPINHIAESDLNVFRVETQGEQVQEIWFSLDDQKFIVFEGQTVVSYPNTLAVFEQQYAGALPVAVKIQYRLAAVDDCLASDDPQQLWDCMRYFAQEYDDALNEREKHLDNLIAIYEKYERLFDGGNSAFVHSQLCWAYTEKANYIFERFTADSSLLCLKKAAAFGEQSRTEKNTRQIRDRLSNTYTNLSWYAVLAGKYSMTLQYANKSLELEPEGVACMGMAITNKALAYLLQGKTDLAFKIYDQYKDNRCTDVKGYQSFRDAFMTDLIQLEEMGLKNPNIKKAQTYLIKMGKNLSAR